MGYVTCRLHRVRCCWRCDRCPKCDGIGRLLRGDYCAGCTAAIKAAGGIWSEFRKDYVLPADQDGQGKLFEIPATLLAVAREVAREGG